MRILRQEIAPADPQFAVATGLVSGEEATPALAAAAVQQALQRAEREYANSVLLFLTSDFARQAQSAVTAASRAANCLQVTGACMPGVLTETDWQIDRPAAAALVLCGNISAATAVESDAVISLAQPEAVTAPWLAAAACRIGGVSTDAGGQRPGRVWSNAKVSSDGWCAHPIGGAHSRTGVSRGIRALGAPLAADASGYELKHLGGDAALLVLKQQLPELQRREPLPLHLLYAAVVDDQVHGDFDVAIAEGRYRLIPVISTNAEFGSITLASQVASGARVFWALRQPHSAEQDMANMLSDIHAEQRGEPAFALMFSCMGRGPYFYGGSDRDLELFRERYPRLPLLGAYCAGEIAPLPSGNALIHNSVVLTLYERADVQPDA